MYLLLPHIVRLYHKKQLIMPLPAYESKTLICYYTIIARRSPSLARCSLAITVQHPCYTIIARRSPSLARCSLAISVQHPCCTTIFGKCYKIYFKTSHTDSSPAGGGELLFTVYTPLSSPPLGQNIFSLPLNSDAGDDCRNTPLARRSPRIHPAHPHPYSLQRFGQRS